MYTNYRISTVSPAVLCDVNHKARRNLSLIKAKHFGAFEMYLSRSRNSSSLMPKDLIISISVKQ